MFWDSFDMGNDAQKVDPLAAVKAELAGWLCHNNSQVYDRAAGVVAVGYMSASTEYFVGDLAKIYIEVRGEGATIDDGFYSFPQLPETSPLDQRWFSDHRRKGNVF